MTSYIIAPAAERDVLDIYQYIARDSVRNANRVLKKLLAQLDLIARMPGVGHTRSELHDDELRVSTLYSYLIIYDATRQPVEIIRVIHGAMDLGQAFYR